jgi:hypothetical protein
MTQSPRATEDARARTGHIIITAVRFGGIAMVMLGFAIVRGIIDLPYPVGVVVAVAGFFDFFFVPRFIARRWNAGAGTKA